MKERLLKNRLKINEELNTYEKRKFFSPACYAESKVTPQLLRKELKGLCIDLGCGDLPFKKLVEEVVDQYDTLDIKKRVEGVKFIGDIQNLNEFNDNTYDSAMCLEVLEHIPEPSKALNEIYRILKPGGSFVCSVPHLSRLHEEPHDYYRYTKHGLKYMFTKAGFSVKSITPVGGLFSFVGHQLSSLLLLPFWHVPVLKQVMFFVNKWLLVKLFYFMDKNTDKNKIFSLGYVCLLEKD